MKYTDVGDDAADAAVQQSRTKLILLAKETAIEAGVKVIEPEQRRRLKTELENFIDATIAKGATYAAGVYRAAAEEFLSVCDKKFVDELKREDVTKFHAGLRRRGLADRTVANIHNRLLSFFRWLKVDIQELAPMKIAYEESLPEIYSDEELRLLFAGIDDERLALAFELLLTTGMREQEAIYMPWSHVNFERGYVRVRSVPEYDFKVKDREQRDIPLSPALLDKLEKWRETNGGKLVLGTDKGKPETKLLRHLKRVARELGLHCGDCAACTERGECERWFLHKFRATYITKLLRSGMDLRTVMKLSGHSDLESVMRYLSPTTDEEIQEHIREMVWIGEPKISKRRAGALPANRRSRQGRSGQSSRTELTASAQT